MTDLSQMSTDELLALYNQEKELAAWGPGARRLPDGSIVREGPRGGLQTLRRAQADPTDPGGIKASAEQRGRVMFSADPLVSAARDLQQIERTPTGAYRNPFSTPGQQRTGPLGGIQNMLDAAGNTFAANTSRSAATREDAGPWAQTLANAVGGEDFQLANQAYGTFEASILPIFSGAAVTASEASRFLRANIPVPGETPEVVRRKERNRKQMANAAAAIIGQQAPFPDAPTAWPLSGKALQEFTATTGGAAPAPAPRVTPQTVPQRAGAPAPRQRPQAPRGPSGRAYTPQQVQAARAIPGGPRGALGSQTNPFMVNTQEQFDRLPSGAFAIDPNGKMGRRP